MFRALARVVMILPVVWCGFASLDIVIAKDTVPASSAVAIPKAITAPSADMIRKWILQLGGNSFEAREEATRRLSAAGTVAIAPLTEAALQDNNLELTIRAIRVLQTIYCHGDDEDFDATEAALEQIADAPHAHAARRATDALRTRAAVRQERAIARIQSLGGAVKLHQLATDVQRGPNGEPLVQQITLLRSWKGGDTGLQEIKRLSLPNYVKVSFYVIKGANVSDEALDAIARELPQLSAPQRRGPAMIGIQADTVERGCQIRYVAENSAAEKAGLDSGDYILQYDGRPVKTFEEVIELTMSKNIGDKVKLEILRHDENGVPQKLTKEIILSEWIVPSTPIPAKPETPPKP